MAYFDDFQLQDYYNYMNNPQGFQADVFPFAGSMQPVQPKQELGNILDQTPTKAAEMAQTAEQNTAQLQQAENAAGAQRDALADATNQQAREAGAQQKQKQQQGLRTAIGLGMMLAGGFGGGAEAAGESAATNAGAEAAAAEGLADDALGSAVTKSAWDKMGFTSPLFSGSNPALGFILGNPQSGFGMMADNYRRYGRR